MELIQTMGLAFLGRAHSEYHALRPARFNDEDLWFGRTQQCVRR